MSMVLLQLSAMVLDTNVKIHMYGFKHICRRITMSYF